MGTPDIAAGCLDALAEAHDVCCAVTRADKPKGRGGAVACSAVKEAAARRGIDVVQPATLKDGKFLETLERYAPDAVAVVAYGLILPRYVLRYPKYGCINVHASLLPKYRGAAPIQWCVAAGERVGGVTTMLMDEGLDTGDMLLKEQVEIPPDMTAGELHDRYCEISRRLLPETLDGVEHNTIVPQPQNHALHTYAPMLTKENTKINWNDTPRGIVNFVRAMNPVPGAHTALNGKKLKIFTCRAADAQTIDTPGTVIGGKDGLTVACGGGAVTVTELQIEGKKRMDAAAFLRGFPITDGTILE
jgi:methionyl-tRNA formyltransferase